METNSKRGRFELRATRGTVVFGDHAPNGSDGERDARDYEKDAARDGEASDVTDL